MSRAVLLLLAIALGACTRAGPAPGPPAPAGDPPPSSEVAPPSVTDAEPTPSSEAASPLRGSEAPADPDVRANPEPRGELGRPVELEPRPEAATPDSMPGPTGPDTPSPTVLEPPPPVDALMGSPAAAHPDLADNLESWFAYWAGTAAPYTRVSLERMGRYGSLVDAALEERGMPRSLRYLPIVESHYNPKAVSWVGAAGMWQFMPGTAREGGLTVTSVVDQRRDPLVATEAALDMLADLHERFDSWFLALAAYNGGPNRMARILRQRFEGRAPSDSLFLEAHQYLPRETQQFIPKFLAAASIGENPGEYGFGDVSPEAPLRFDEVTVPDATSLDVIAEAAESTQDEVELLNPHLVRGLTPAGVETTLRVPFGKGPTFARKYLEIPPDERVSFLEHAVARGETLGHIAEMYGVRVAELQAANPRVRPRYLQVGQSLVVPAAGSASRGASTTSTNRPAEATPARAAERAQGTGSATHMVRAGDSLWEIARSYGVTVDELSGWNSLDSDGAIYPGDRLELREVGLLVYRVRAGDTLSGIASRYEIGMAELARWNGMTRDELIHPGDEIRIPPRGSGR